MSPVGMMASPGVNKLLSMFEFVRRAGQDMSHYDAWVQRRGMRLLKRVERLYQDRDLAVFIDKYAGCLADSVIDLLQAQAPGTVAELAVDLLEELAAQAHARLQAVTAETIAEAQVREAEKEPELDPGSVLDHPLAA